MSADDTAVKLSQTWMSLGVDQTLDSGATIQPSYDDDLDSWTSGTHPLPRVAVSDEESADPNHDLRIVGVLGEGGMGTVYLADQRSLMRQVAVKRTKSRDTGAEIRQMLLEARYTGSLEHPNVIPVHGLGLDEERRPVLIMKRVEGTAWSTLIRDPEHPQWEGISGDSLEWHVRTLLQVCNAVHFAHTRRILHRDIKPDNVMIGHFGEVYVLDWGVAQDLSRPPSDVERMVGTPAYMAPELTQGDESMMSVATDVYLLGACLHEVLTGGPPHRREDTFKTLYAAFASEPESYPDSVPSELAAICRRAMAREVADRYPSALALRQDLDRFLTHLSSIRLTVAAKDELMRLKDLVTAGGDDGDVHETFSAARFGFEQALALWRESEAATAGRAKALEIMARYALDQGDFQHGERLLAELEQPPEALVAMASSLRLAAAEKDKELEGLRGMQLQLESSATLKARMAGLIIQTVLMTVGFGTAAVLKAKGIYTPGHAEHFGIIFLLALAGVVVHFKWDRDVREHLGTRRLSKSVMFMGVGLLGHAVFAATVGSTMATTASVDFLIIGTCMAATSVHGDRFIVGPGVGLILAALIMAIWPEHYLWVLAGMSFLMPVLIGIGSRITGTGPQIG